MYNENGLISQYCTVFAQYLGWAVFIQTISKDRNSGWAMPTQIISRVDPRPPCPPSAGAHGVLIIEHLIWEN